MMNLIPKGFYLDDIFDDMEKEMRLPRENHMKCDVYEKDGKYHVEMDIPGFDKKDIKIECNEGVLTVAAKKEHNKDEEHKDNNGKKYIRKERYFGSTSRSFSFADIDEENIKAEFKNGTLLLTIPKKEKVDNKKIINID